MISDTIAGVPDSLLGIRHWGNYKEPMPFNIVVNSMQEVLKHKDRTHQRRDDISIASSAGTHGFRVNV